MAGRLMSQPVLEVKDLSVRRGGAAVLHDVTLTIGEGEVVAVLGPNGAGKSTLLETIAGVLRASSGSVVRRGRVATAMQSPDLANRNAQRNVELALAWWGVARSQRRPRATAALAAMQAGHLADRPAAAMSGGERRRVHLARAVAIQPDVLLLDEPFAGLDPATRASLLDDAAAAIRTSAQAVVVVVHDRSEAWALADRIVVLMDGRLVASGQPREVLERPPSVAVARFLGFTGELRFRDEVVVTRPSHVQLDPVGDVAATVTRLVPIEDGARAELHTDTGRLFAVVPYPGPAVGETVRVRVTGGVRFPAGGG
jgi:ABC-type sulfate/molybdate transport systems ATPase subunit